MNKPAPPADSAPAASSAAASPPPTVRSAGDGDACPNCGSSMWGEFCFACGQPRKGLVRRFTSIMGDFLDTVLDIDNRLWRTLAPLYFKPGQLTVEYIAGRRVRYVTPFRLFFFLCIVSFLALKLYAADSPATINFDGDTVHSIGSATTVEEVDAQLNKALAGVDAGRAAVKAGIAAAGSGSKEPSEQVESGFAKAEQKLRAQAQIRKDWLALAAQAKSAGLAAPPEPKPPVEDITLNFGDDRPWDAQSNPIAITWLPNAVNASLNERASRAQDALSHARENPRPLIEAFFGAIPPASFVLIPLFALLLKIMFIFKRRLYMEHMLTALHSHAFIFLSLLMIVSVLAVHDVLDASHTALRSAAEWMIWLMAWWVPIHLLIAQKRIYRQGWIMTVIKFGIIGISYMILVAICLALAIVLGLFTI